MFSLEKKVLVIKRFLWILLDVLLLAASLFLGLVLYFDIKPPEAHLIHTLRSIPLLAAATIAVLWLSGLYKSLIRFASVDTFLQIMLSTLAGTGITYIISLVFYLTRGDGPNIFLMPRPVYLLQWLIAVFLIAWSRFAGKMHFSSRHKHTGRRILIIGAGYAGATVIRDIQSGRYGEAVAVAVLDNDPSKQNASLSRIPVTDEDVKTAVEKYRIDEIIVTVGKPAPELIDECVGTGVKVRVFSEARGVVRELNIADLLGRPETHLDMNEAKAYFGGKTVLVTGGGGSIGSELCRQILSFTPKKLVIYDMAENYMYDLLFELREKFGELVNNTVVLEVGSVRDEESLWRVMGRYRPDVVIHAAAHKHVPLMEQSPEQAILNNVFGTEKTARIAMACGVERFVLISTDKAVNPTNVMGATKRLAEMVISSLQGEGKTQFVAVRFGNVLGSHGSVVPIFKRQIRQGGPVTLTHPDIIRYFMTIPEAASLVLQAAGMAKGGELYVLDMGEPVRIRDLAERMIRLYGSGNEQIVYTGLRPGEKLYEELLRDEENDIATEKERIYITRQEKMSREEVGKKLDILEQCLERNGDIKSALRQVVPTYQPQ